jgi:NAD-dependent SIR2 family protein deacetylase
MRDFSTRSARDVHDHTTGRSCPKCGGALHDTIINFNESLPEHALQNSFRQAKRADLCISLGSSLRVTPAANIPQIVGQKSEGRLVIVNLQATPSVTIMHMNTLTLMIRRMGR